MEEQQDQDGMRDRLLSILRTEDNRDPILIGEVSDFVSYEGHISQRLV